MLHIVQCAYITTAALRAVITYMLQATLLNIIARIVPVRRHKMRSCTFHHPFFSIIAHFLSLFLILSLSLSPTLSLFLCLSFSLSLFLSLQLLSAFLYFSLSLSPSLLSVFCSFSLSYCIL